MIPAQIPPDRDDWPPGVLDALRAFRQGDVIVGLPYFYWGNPALPVLDLTGSYADEGEGVIESSNRFDYGMIATQTCDLVEEDSDRPGQPWVHLCPVYNAETTYRPDGTPPETVDNELPKLIPGAERKLIRQGRSQRYLWLPALSGGTWIADLRLFIPVEKGWLAGQERIEGFRTESERIVAGHRLAWLHDRPAFDGHFVQSVQTPLRQALMALRRDDRLLFDRLSELIPEIGVSTEQNIAIDTAELVVLCEGQPDQSIIDWFHRWWAESAERAMTHSLTLLPLRFELLDEMPASHYRRLTRLPLASVSPNPSWYGPDPYEL